MSIIVTVRIATTLEAVARAEEQHPGLYERVIELAYAHGMISHRRVYREGEIMDIDEWPNEEARMAFRAEAGPLVEHVGIEIIGTEQRRTIFQPRPLLMNLLQLHLGLIDLGLHQMHGH